MFRLNSEIQKYFQDQKQKLTNLKTAWSAMDSTTGNNYPKILSLYIMYITILFILFLVFININHLLCYKSNMCDIFIWLQ